MYTLLKKFARKIYSLITQQDKIATIQESSQSNNYNDPDLNETIINADRELIAKEFVKLASLEKLNMQNKHQFYEISDQELIEYYNCNIEISEEFQEECHQLANEFIDLLIQSLNIINFRQRDTQIFLMRYNFKQEARILSLQTIGDEFKITRERVRQLVNRQNDILSKAIKNNPDIMFSRLRLLIDFLIKPGVGDYHRRFVLFYMNGFYSHNIFVFKLLSKLIFDKEEQHILESCYIQYTVLLKKSYVVQRELNKSRYSFNNRIGNKIQWPKKLRILSEVDYKKVSCVREVNHDNSSNSGEYYSNKMKKNMQFESELEKKILTVLEDSNLVIFYEVQPFKISYRYFRDRIYVPDVFFVLEGGKGVIAEIKPRFHMATEMNYQKYKILKRHCDIMGYGMLVTDSRTSFEQLISYDYNKLFEQALLQRLDQGPIKWPEYYELSNRYDNVRYQDLACIVINNDLLYHMGPFNLDKRRNY